MLHVLHIQKKNPSENVSLEMLEFLIKHGAQIHEEDNYGNYTNHPQLNFCHKKTSLADESGELFIVFKILL